MKRGDIVWGLLLASLLVLFVIPATRDSILAASSAHPYIGGFVQFSIFMGGAGLAQAGKLLPFAGVSLAQAFCGSSIMNLTFAPAMNTFHRIMELWIETAAAKEPVTLKGLIGKIDWTVFVTFNWLKVGICFWIPVHTIVFLLPENIRVVVAAFSSIALGIILSFASKKGSSPTKISEEEVIYFY